jgi:hypothetical protein
MHHLLPCCFSRSCSFYFPDHCAAGVSTFVSEFVKRKLAEQNRKPGGKKKKGGTAAAAAAAVPAAVPASSGVSAAGVGMINTGEALGIQGFA